MRRIYLVIAMLPLLMAMTCDDDASDDHPTGTWTLVNITVALPGLVQIMNQEI